VKAIIYEKKLEELKSSHILSKIMARELQIMPKSKKVPQENLGTLFFHGACFQLYLFAS
jgi:hypothetical protein